MAMLRLEYGQVTFTRVVYYLAGVSVFQCISALLIDKYTRGGGVGDIDCLLQC